MENASLEGAETVADVVTEPGEQNPNEAEEDQQAPRRSSRESRPTERMALYMQTEFEKGEKKLSSVYNDWQFNVKKLRNFLRTDSDHTDIAETSDTVKNYEQRAQ
ncbi:hypothetical protein MAR_006588 [Mya arenaria]|uniref:Uncharacterized protein n=1 Tax=Mya arenaria TaxID=6604 RepID=A0ABY7D902_MYAAR|nr:hypothetical protein MAR_006588 [Mya arenaria]